MLCSIDHLSRSAAEALRPDPDTAVISITDTGAPPARLEEGFWTVVRLVFDDVTAPTPWLGRVLVPISDAQADRLVEFLEHAHGSARRLALVCHCEAGISRSAAVAQFAAERYGLPFDPTYPFANIEVLRRLRTAAGA